MDKHEAGPLSWLS